MLIKSLLKITFALSIVSWLVAKGQLDFSLIIKNGDNFKYLALAFGIIVIQFLIGGYRWKVLLEIKSLKALSFIDIIRINWIGLFFNSFLPGNITGDVVKIFYIKKLDQSLDKTFLIMSIILDRSLGLSGLILIMGFFSFFNYEALSSLSPNMEIILKLNILIFFSVIVFLLFLFLPLNCPYLIFKVIKKISSIWPFILKIYEHLRNIEKDKKSLLFCLLLGLIMQFLHIISFLIATFPFYEKSINFFWAFSIIPLGDIAMIFPISPAGLGVGHMVFQSLFKFIGVNNGANLFNVYFIVMISVNFLGFFPYIFSGKNISLSKLKETV